MARVEPMDIWMLRADGIGDAASLAAAKAAKDQARTRFAARLSTSAAATRQAARGLVVNAPPAAISGGKVVVQAPTFWNQWNDQAKQLIAPVAPAIAASALPADVKQSIINTPLDALLDTFDPIEDRIGKAIDRVIARKGKTYNYFGHSKNVSRVQTIDTKADASTQNLMRRMRTIDAFVVLFVCAPLELAQECIKEGIDLAGEAVAWAADTAEAAAAAAGRLVNDAAAAGQAAFAEVSSWFGLGSLGEPATGISVAGIAISETVVFGTVIDAIITVVLNALVVAITSAISAFGLALASGKDLQTAANYALYAGLTAGTSILAVQLPALITGTPAGAAVAAGSRAIPSGSLAVGTQLFFPAPASDADQDETETATPASTVPPTERRPVDAFPVSTPAPAKSNTLLYAGAGAAGLGLAFLLLRKKKR